MYTKSVCTVCEVSSVIVCVLRVLVVSGGARPGQPVLLHQIQLVLLPPDVSQGY